MRIQEMLIAAAVSGIAAGCGGSTANQPAPSAASPSGASTEAMPMAKHDCKGKNDCKGQGGCKVEGQNECKGQNSCKGKGGCKTT